MVGLWFLRYVPWYYKIFRLPIVSGSSKYQRRGPQRIFGTEDYSYNYANIVDAKPLTKMYGVPRHSMFVRGRRQVTSLPENAKVRLFSFDVPANLYPFDTFRLMLDGLEVLVQCPNVSGPGETVWVFAEHDEASAYVWKVVDSCAATNVDSSVFYGTVAVYTDSNEIPFAKQAYYSSAV